MLNIADEGLDVEIASMGDAYDFIQRFKERIPPVGEDGGVALVRDWAKRDAQIVVSGQHVRGRQAAIRLNFIKGFKSLTLEKKKSLYADYVKKLNEEIAELDGGKSYGSVPSFN